MVAARSSLLTQENSLAPKPHLLHWTGLLHVRGQAGPWARMKLLGYVPLAGCATVGLDEAEHALPGIG